MDVPGRPEVGIPQGCCAWLLMPQVMMGLMNGLTVFLGKCSLF